ncbi:efflux RND transporter periplasmic adaptor subunit [Thalassotalea nanhaiensis]|uniref:Efflux RND transporter periplasmic adaptor subunit n=1 Tax=Thalassotalea nanhaiensis TaxID=3065648 RepID=A0ABY9TLB1_9GAMM|nr:efflux RND transporter periplasmic adaptor subunit [Colwelliaceae bacterium SQ345]
MESEKTSRLPLIILSGLLIALLGYLYLPEENVSQSQSARVVSVKTTPVVLAEFSDEFEALGTTKANEDVIIAAQYSDIIESIHFDDGDTVKKGDILVELFKKEEQAKIKELQANLDQASAQLQRYKDLLKQSAASIAQRDEQKAKVQSFRAQLLSAQATLNNLTIRAPFDGQLGFRQVSVGALINDGSTITTLDDISIIKLDFAIPERFITTVNIGQAIAATNVAYPGVKFIGKVTSISPRVDAVTRTIQIRAEIDNSNMQLRPGMLMSIILERNVAQVLQIPESAVIPFEDKHFVFVVQNDTAKRVDISVGRRKPGIVEVSSGIKEGTKVVIEGALKLRDGAKVKAESSILETK